DEVEERVDEELLLQVLLEVEQGHVEHVHRLVEARVDLQLLAHADRLLQAGLHVAPATVARAGRSASKRARSRAVRVGPKYTRATSSSSSRSRTGPETITAPSNMM